MKKLFITLAFVAATVFAQAQLFVGGNLGVNMGSTKVESTKTQKTFGFEVKPNVGYMFSENMGAGIALGYASDKTTTPKNGDNPETWSKENTFSIMPYFRYVFAEVDNFKFYADAQVKFAKTNEKMRGADEKTVDGDKTTNLGINIVPGLQYNFDEHFSMVAELNVLKLGWNNTTVERKTFNDEGKEVTEKTKTNNFGLGINTPSPITIGFVYTF